MHFLPAPVLPQPGIGLIEQVHGAATKRLQPLEFLAPALAGEPAIEELLGGGQHHGAVDVVLDLPVGLVADPDRTHAPIAGKRFYGSLLQARPPGHAVDRLELLRASQFADDVVQVAEKRLHGLCNAQPVERLDHVIAVPQPAETVVPVAAAVGGFRNRRGQRCKDRAGVFVGTEL